MPAALNMVLAVSEEIKSLNWLVIGLLVSLALAFPSGVFVRKKIYGPSRISPGEPAALIAYVASLGLLAFFVSSLILQATCHPVAGHGTPRQQVAFNAIPFLVAVIIMIGASEILRFEGIKRLGLGLKYLSGGIVRGILSLLIVFAPLQLVSIGTDWLWNSRHWQHPSAHELLLEMKQAPPNWIRWALIFVAVVLAPLTEELFFRGHIQTLIRVRTRSPWLAVIVTSIVFAAVHYPAVWMMPEIFFLAIALGYIYERTGNLWANVTLHALFNLANVLFFWYVYIHLGQPACLTHHFLF